MKASKTDNQHSNDTVESENQASSGEEQIDDMSTEYNGPKGPEPTRYGDWERNGRCVDF